MQNNKTAAGIPAEVLDVFDNLNWEDVPAEALENFTITGIENACECITLCGIYPMKSAQLYVISCILPGFLPDEDSAYTKFQRAAVPKW